MRACYNPAMPGGAFNPYQLLEGETVHGSFLKQPVYEVFTAIIESCTTGALGVPGEVGLNRLFFREGHPVGVSLAESYVPLGQLLLELGYIDGATFLRAKPIIEGERRLPGQVYIQLGAIDNAILTEVLQIQAQRKARRFVEGCQDPFEFSRGLAFLTGFAKSDIGADLLIFFALEHAFGDREREDYLRTFTGKQICIGADVSPHLGGFGFGVAEQRFLTRLQTWRSVDELDRFGTLARPEVALILKFLDMRHMLQLRPALDGLAPPPARAEEQVFTAPPASAQDLDETARLRPVKQDKGWPKKEQTERISIAVDGWSDPRPAREERTDIVELPSVLVDYAALGVKPEDEDKD